MDAGATLIAVVIAAPLFALLRLGAEALKSVDLPLPAVVLESLLAPGVVLLVCAGCWALDRPLDVPVLLLGGVAGYAVATVAVGFCLQARLAGHRPSSEPLPVAGTQLGALWATSVFSIVFLHLPFMLLPLFASVSETGIFAVAYKLVNVITTLLLLFAAVFGPAFARAAAAGDVRGLMSLLWRTQYLSLAVFTPMVGILLLSADWLTELFSLPAGSMEPIMLALLAGQLVNAATGLPGVMLNMAGAAGRELATLLATLLLAGMAVPFVGAAFGAVGIAWLFSALLAFKNLVSYFAARHFLNELETRA